MGSLLKFIIGSGIRNSKT